MKLGLVVEGHGEHYAAPILVRRIAASIGVADARSSPSFDKLVRELTRLLLPSTP